MKIKMALPEFLIMASLAVGSWVAISYFWQQELRTVGPEALLTKPKAFVTETKEMVLPEKMTRTEMVRTIANFVWRHRNDEQYHLTVTINRDGKKVYRNTFLVDHEKLELAKSFATMERHGCNSHVKAIYAKVIQGIGCPSDS
jgi:hypothetical protein